MHNLEKGTKSKGLNDNGNRNTFINTIRGSWNDPIQLIRHTTLKIMQTPNIYMFACIPIIEWIQSRSAQCEFGTHRFWNKSDRSRTVEFALHYILKCTGSVAYFKGASLDSTNSCWANKNLHEEGTNLITNFDYSQRHIRLNTENTKLI